MKFGEFRLPQGRQGVGGWERSLIRYLEGYKNKCLAPP